MPLIPIYRLIVIFAFLISTTRIEAATPKTIEEALQCMIFVQTYSANGDALSRGSGFVANDAGVQWIFTNAHVIEGAARIEFFDYDGLKLSDFGRFQCFSMESGSGDFGKDRFGGDGIRIEIKNKRTIAFNISKKPEQYTNQAKVITIGDNDGDREFEVLEGVITAASSHIIQSTCQTRPGSSGGALIDPITLDVIGLHTFGISGAVKLTDAIWQQGIDDKVAGAAILSSAKWIDMKASDFLAGSQVAMQFRDTVRMLAFINSLVPQEDGFKVNPNNRFTVNLTYEQAFDNFSRDPILRLVIDLNRRLAGRGGIIGINSMELVRVYSDAITKIRESYINQRQESIKALAPYYLIDFQNSGYYEVGDWCYINLEDAEVWFRSKSRVGGSMPAGRWFNLRPLSEIGK